MLIVSDITKSVSQPTRIGTIRFEDGKAVADPTYLLDLVETRTQRGMTLEEARKDLAGWTNGYVVVTEETEYARKLAAVQKRTR